MVRIWTDLGPKVRAATNTCDVRTWRYLQPEILDLVEARRWPRMRETATS